MQWHHSVSIMEAIESTSSGETRGVRVFEGKLPCEAQSLTKTTREREMTSEASLASMARSMTLLETQHNRGKRSLERRHRQQMPRDVIICRSADVVFRRRSCHDRVSCGGPLDILKQPRFHEKDGQGRKENNETTVLTRSIRVLLHHGGCIS